MKLKYEIFIILIIPTFLMLSLQFLNAVIIFIVSQNLIDEYTQNLYLDQQQQTKDIISAYSYEFSSIFQSFSMNLQIFVNFESKVLSNQVTINPNYKQTAIFIEKLYKEDPSQKEMVDLYKKDDLLVSAWIHPNISNFDQLDSTGQYQIKTAGYIDFLWRAFDYQNRMDRFRRSIPVKDIYQGFVQDGSLYSTSSNTTFQNYQKPQNCQYGGKYKFDSRCRIWFLETINRIGVTPVPPAMFYSQANSPFLATNLCQRQNILKQNSSGNYNWIPYSIDCLNFKVSNLYSFFSEQTFDYSNSIMIDPRSQAVVYNQLQKFNNSLSYLSDAAKSIFPNNSQNSDLFLKTVSEKLNSMYNITAKQNSQQKTEKEDQNLIQTNDLEYNNTSFYDDYTKRVSNIVYSQLDQDDVQSFEFDTIDGDDIFVVLSPIKIAEKLGDYQRKLKNQQDRKGFDLQDLFVVIDVLPKAYLTEFSDEVSKTMSIFFLSYGIGSCIALTIFSALYAYVSLRVAVMIETPITHMTQLLKKLEKEGSQVTLEMLDETIQMPVDKIILSLDSLILFESFISMFKMLHYVTQDIFSVEESESLLRLNQQVSFFKKFNNYRALGICYNNMGNIHFQSERYNEAMENYYHSIVYGYYELGCYKEKKISTCDQEQFLDNLSQNQLRISSSKCKSNSQNNHEERGLNTNQENNKANANQQHQSISTKFRNTNSSTRNQNSGAENNNQEQNQNSQDQRYHHQTILGLSQDDHGLDSRVVDVINQIIFDRRFNFAKAFNMLNMQLQRVGQSQCILWEEYEIVLLDLLNFNERLKSISYGRTILLTTQLSLCYLQMNDHKRSIYYQKQAIKSYNDALEIESLAKKHNLKKYSVNSPRNIGHLRLDFSQEEDNDENNEIDYKQDKSNNIQNKENSILNNHFLNEVMDDNLENSFKKQNRIKVEQQSTMTNEINRLQNTIDMNKVMQQATKNMEEEISIDNLFKKRYSNAHNIQIDVDHLSYVTANLVDKNKNNKLKPYQNVQQSEQEEEKQQQQKDQNCDKDEQNKSQSYHTNNFNNSVIDNSKRENNLKNQENSDQFKSHASNEQNHYERDRLHSEQSNFQRKPRRSKYQQESFQVQDTHRTRGYSNERQYKKNLNINYNQNKLNNSFSTNRNSKSNYEEIKRNSFKNYQQYNNLLSHQKQNALCVTYSAGSNYFSNYQQGQFNTVTKHAATLPPNQHQENQFQNQNNMEYNHHRSNSSLVRRHVNSASSQNQQIVQKIQSLNVNSYHIDLNRPRSIAQQQLPIIQYKDKFMSKLSVIPSHQGTLNMLTQDTSNNKITQHSLVANNFNNYINARVQPQVIRCKDCSVYDDIASISSHIQQQNNIQTVQQQLHSSNNQHNQMLIKKHKIKKKNLHLISKINKNLEENDGKKISKYQLPCNILLYYVGIQEAKILIYEKQFQSAGYLLTELLENVKYYLPYYRKQCLILLNDIFEYSCVNIQKQLHDMIERFDSTITFKVTTIIAVNTAYSDSAKTCQHLIKEILTKDEDLFSLIIFNSQILKQVMPPICMKQVKSAQDYFDALLSYISGDADSVDISSYSYEMNDDQQINFSSLQNNQNNQYLNPSIARSNTNHTYPTFTENNDLNIQTMQNDQQNLFTEKSHHDILQLLSPTEPDQLKRISQKHILGTTEMDSPRTNNLNFKFNMPITTMAPIRESSKEINLVESNLMEPYKILTPQSVLKTQSDIISNRNLWNVSITNIKNKNPDCNHLLKNSIILENSENVENNENFTEKKQNYNEKDQQITSSSRKKSVSISKSSKYTEHEPSSSKIKSPEELPGDIIINRIRNCSAPENPQDQQLPQIVITERSYSENSNLYYFIHKLEKVSDQNNMENHLQEKSNIRGNNEHLLKVDKQECIDPAPTESQFKLQKDDQNKKQFDKTQKQQIQNDNYPQQNQILSSEYLIQKDLTQIGQDENQLNEENNNKLRSMVTLNNTYQPIIRSSFSKQDDIKKSRVSNAILSQGTLPSVQQIPVSLQSKQFSSMIEQEEEEQKINNQQNDIYKRKKIVLEQLTRVESKRYIEHDDILSYQSSQRNQINNKLNYQDLNINQQNINQVFHLAVRKALENFFGNDLTRYKQQIIQTEENVINKFKKFIVFITDVQGFKENKLYDLMAEELYKAQAQLLILQLDYEESIQENTKNQDVFFKGKSVIKYFYTQEKLLQYIRNKREPMKNFGIPLMIEHFQ